MRIYSTFQFYFHFEQCIIYLAERTKIIDVMLNQNKIKHTKKKKRHIQQISQLLPI